MIVKKKAKQLNPDSMKKIGAFFLVLVLVGFPVQVWADTIILKNKKKIEGKILRVTAANVEYDPAGEVPFRVIARDQVAALEYADGSRVNLSGTGATSTGTVKADPPPQMDRPNILAEIELGWNNYVGLGGRLTFGLGDHFALNAGAGLAGWGVRLSGGLRYYVSGFAEGFALTAGAAFNPGSGGQAIENQLEVETSNGSETKAVPLIYEPVSTAQAGILYSWKIGTASYFYLEGGYSALLTEETYTVDSGQTLTEYSEDFLDFFDPGGIHWAFGFSFVIH